MDSYSVNETAAVLGIPEGRVWELLARGVLAGSTEVGGDMRVTLRGAPLPDAGTAPAQDAFRRASGPTQGAIGGNGGSGGNGGNGDSHGEQTPFRELLTEFRNLTERYGQALLALGESRGEVAALRGRVDLLEARIDHRLPWTEAPPAGWTAEALPEPERAEEPEQAEEPETANAPQAAAVPETAEEPAASEPAADETPMESQGAATPAPVGDAEGDTDADPGAGVDADGPAEAVGPAGSDVPDLADEDASSAARPSKAHARSRSREAVSGFAEALARAEDPTTALVGDEEPLPGTQDIADAMAAYRREVDPETGTTTDRSQPAEEAPETEDDADAEDASPIVRTRYSTATPEPDWIAEEDLFVLAAADADPSPEADAPAASAPTAEPAIRAWAAEPVQPAPDEMSESVAEATNEPEPAAGAEPQPEPEPEPVVEPVVEPEPVVGIVAATAIDGEVDAPQETPSPVPVADPWIDDEPEPAPVSYSDAIAIGEPAPEPTIRTPIEIAAEPPAPDDVALLVGPAAFSEPPQIPREPAFWEAGARARAPFAIPHLDAWESSSAEAVTVMTDPEPPAIATPDGTATPPPSPAESSSAPSTPLDTEVAWGVAPVSEPPAPEPEPAGTVLPGQAPIRPARTTRPRRGATARAIRRLRLLLD